MIKITNKMMKIITLVIIQSLKVDNHKHRWEKQRGMNMQMKEEKLLENGHRILCILLEELLQVIKNLTYL